MKLLHLASMDWLVLRLSRYQLAAAGPSRDVMARLDTACNDALSAQVVDPTEGAYWWNAETDEVLCGSEFAKCHRISLLCLAWILWLAHGRLACLAALRWCRRRPLHFRAFLRAHFDFQIT